MSDVDRMLAQAAAAQGQQGVPILGQPKPPTMSGININGMVMTINEIEQLPERDFRELMLAVIINLCGGTYSPTYKVVEGDTSEPAAAPEEEELLQGATSLDNSE